MLWFLVVSEKSFDYTTDIPILTVGLKADRALLKPLPTEATVKFHGRGRELLRLIYVNKPHLKLDLTHPPSSNLIRMKPEMVVITGGLLVSVIDVISPDSISLRLDDYRQITVPVMLASEVTLEPGYVIVGTPVVEPSQIVLMGPEKELRGIKSVSTERFIRTGLKQTVEVPLGVVLPNGFGIEASTRAVRVTVKVERLGERSLEGLPLSIRSAPAGKILEVEPKAVKVMLTGPVSLLADLRLENLTAWVDWSESESSKPGWLPVHVEPEPGIEVKMITPALVRAVLRKH